MVITLIHNEPPCARCEETRRVLDDVVAACPGTCEIRSLTVTEAREAGYGVVLTPTVLLDNQVLCAGIVPRKDGLLRLVKGA